MDPFWVFVILFLAAKYWVKYHKAVSEAEANKLADLAFQRSQENDSKKTAAYAAWEQEIRRKQQADTEEKFARMDSNLWLLGLSTYPQSLADLQRAYRKKMFEVHPDVGGSPADASAVNNAYLILKQRYRCAA